MILGSFMLIGWLLSMWISNTATASMLIPIAVAVAKELDPSLIGRKPDRESPLSVEETELEPLNSPEKTEKELKINERRLCNVLLMSTHPELRSLLVFEQPWQGYWQGS